MDRSYSTKTCWGYWKAGAWMELTMSTEGRATKEDNKWEMEKYGKVWREMKAIVTNRVRWKVLTEALCSTREWKEIDWLIDLKMTYWKEGTMMMMPMTWLFQVLRNSHSFFTAVSPFTFYCYVLLWSVTVVWSVKCLLSNLEARVQFPTWCEIGWCLVYCI